MDGFSSARPHTEEGASQGAQSCQTYDSSRFAFRVIASWGATLALLSELLPSELYSDDVEDVPPLLELVVDELSVSEPSDSSDARSSGRQSSSASLVVRCVPYLSPLLHHPWLWIVPSSLVGKMATSPLPSRGSPLLQSGGTKSEGAHLWAKWLPHPCRLGDPHRLRAGGQNHKWPTCGQNGYVTLAVSGIPTA